MKKFLTGAIGAIGMLVAPVAASAADSLTYEEVAHCAAFNLFASDIYGGGSDPEKTKDKSEKFKNQAVALMVAGVALSKKEAEVVVNDVKARKQVMWDMINDADKVNKLIQDNTKNCNMLGEVAAEALAKNTK
ncbi:MAG: hypothetical protein KGZ65_08150 [Sphingomonadales bacterium]|nr:hypothetical protein [Sphingomonadaceae bacterium]MBS3931192.1 hypothetical protein [Sphingomonadales bacterium]